MSSSPASFSLVSEELAASASLLPAQPQCLKAIVFNQSSHTFALPLIAAVKVINFPPDLSQQMDDLGLIYLGQAAIKIVNPATPEAISLLPAKPANGQFLVILQARPGTLYGIPVDTPPDVIDLPVTSFRTVPDAHHQGSLFHWVRYVSIPPEAEAASARIYLLDMQRVANTPLNL
jgi:hypothetical protein